MLRELSRAFFIQALAFLLAAAGMTSKGYVEKTDKYVDDVKSNMMFFSICLGISLVFMLLSCLV